MGCTSWRISEETALFGRGRLIMNAMLAVFDAGSLRCFSSVVLISELRAWGPAIGPGQALSTGLLGFTSRSVHSHLPQRHHLVLGNGLEDA
jgi:hypothetical protein